MRILYLSQYFPPEVGATQERGWEMARGLAQRGHHVTVLTEVPNHPSGVVAPSYRRRAWVRRNQEGVEILHLWVRPSVSKGSFGRMAFYASFMATAVAAGSVLARGPFDVIYASSPPLPAAAAGLVLSLLRRTPLVMEVRDIWPAAAVEFGELSNATAITFATWLELRCYRRARRVVTVTDSFASSLAERGVPAEELVVIPNGSNVELFRFRPEGRTRVRRELGLGDDLVVIYAGLHGLAQGLETVIQAAIRLQRQASVRFLFLGEGPRKSHLQELAARASLSNLTFLPEQPREAVPDYLSAADVAVVPQRRLPLLRRNVPVKLFDAWACERPVLLGVDGEARSLLEAARAGLYFEPESSEALTRALSELANRPEERRAMGMRGRELTVDRFSRQAQARALAGVLEALK